MMELIYLFETSDSPFCIKDFKPTPGGVSPMGGMVASQIPIPFYI